MSESVILTWPSERITLRWVWRGIQADIEQTARYSSAFSIGPLSLLRRVSFMCTPPILCSGTYRVSHWLYRCGLTLPACCLWWLNLVIHRADLSCAAEIGPGLYIPHTSGVIFRGRAGSNLTLLFRSAVVGDRVDAHHERVGRGCPRLGDGVTVGVFSVIKGEVTIGDGAFVGAASTVRTDLPAEAVVVVGRLLARRSQ